MTQTFSTFAFGCRVNAAEKEMLDRKLLETGFQYKIDNPDIYIINTCAVTRKAEREARQLIYQTKKKWLNTKVVVTGCAATKWINENIQVNGVDWIVDNTNKEYIATLLNSKFKSQSSKPNLKNKKLQIKNKYILSGRLLLKIQDGCHRFCTFCIVPYLRGQPKSERIKNIELRIKNHEKDIREVILTAINTQAFGYETGETFIDLIKTVLNKTKVPRISFGSVHPWSITNEFLQFYEKILPKKRLVNFFHIPLQSGSNKILSYMKRDYTREEILVKLETIQKINPLAFIATDIIVGFLEETDKDFEDTYNFLLKSQISKFHVFRYSPREKTAGFFMRKRLKEPTPSQKSQRAKTLIELSKNKYQKFLEKHIGKTFPALFLEKRIDGFQEVLLDNQIPVMIKSDKDFRGEIKFVNINYLKDGKLVGNIF